MVELVELLELVVPVPEHAGHPSLAKPLAAHSSAQVAHVDAVALAFMQVIS